MTHPYKHRQPHTLVLRLPSKMAHTLRVACFLPGLTFLHYDSLLSPACAKPSPHIRRPSQGLRRDLGCDPPLSPHSLSRNTAAISPSLRDHWSVKRAPSFWFVHCFLCCAEAFQFDASYPLALFLWLVLLVSSSKPSLWRPMPKNFSPMLSFRSFVVSGLMCKPLIYLGVSFLYGIRDLSCSIRNRICAPCIESLEF